MPPTCAKESRYNFCFPLALLQQTPQLNKQPNQPLIGRALYQYGSVREKRIKTAKRTIQNREIQDCNKGTQHDARTIQSSSPKIDPSRQQQSLQTGDRANTHSSPPLSQFPILLRHAVEFEGTSGFACTDRVHPSFYPNETPALTLSAEMANKK